MPVWKRPDGIYQYDFRLKGRRYNGPTGVRERRAALVVEAREREKVREKLKKLSAAAGAADMTVEIAFARFWAEVGTHYSGNYRQTVWAALRWLTAELGAATPLRDLGANRITQAIAKRRADDVSPSTVNRTVTELLRTVMRRAVRAWEQETQAHKIEWHRLMLREPQERVRELRDHEETKLVVDMRDDYLPVVRLAVLSGLRKKELVGLTWSAIDWTARTISVRGKGDRVRLVPLTDGMRAILSPLRGHHPEAVFTYVATRADKEREIAKGKRYPITYAGLSSVWRRFADLTDFRFHDLRHTAATRLLRATGNLRFAQRLLGHSTISTTARYAHVTDEDLRAGMEAAEQAAPVVKPAPEPAAPATTKTKKTARR
ncbi:MAG TPA: site-specific integrase [Pseudolabrys sp.]|uniref:tyrosine-type recombinase/integrase n=1 Tax=Pseudolabrys sp. TaxID=1960880 RepID=UPI002DDCC3B0|nr:site-specific integrase [Pseudolabrys sp.]HEV2630568.1 site-specific integrase [Pseudolabrys sp.]